MPSAPSAPTAPAVADVLGPPPKAPHVPDVEDVLGPPPRPPRIGGRGHVLGKVGGLGHAPRAPRVGRSVQSADNRQQAQRPQRIVIEDRRAAPPVPTRERTLQEEYAPVEPEVTPQAGRPIQRAARNAGLIRDRINGLRHPQAAEHPAEHPAEDDETPTNEPRPANVQAHHEETRRQIREAMERLRGHGPQEEAQP